MNLEEIITVMLEGNTIRRILGKRRPLKKDMRANLDNLRYRANKQSSLDYHIDGYIEVFKNNVQYLKDCYYDVSEFEEIIKNQYGGLQKKP